MILSLTVEAQLRRNAVGAVRERSPQRLRLGYPIARRRRRVAAERACFESALWDAARRGSRLRARDVARDRFAEGFFRVPL